MNPRIALVDLDGTLADYHKALQCALAKIASPGEPDFQSFMDVDRPAWLEARRILVSSVPGFWRDLQPLMAGEEILGVLREHDFILHVLTKGPKSNADAWKEKFEWCRVHVPDATVSVTENKSLSYGAILVDDWPPYIKGWLKHRPRGVVIVPAQPWNLDIETHAPENIFRYDPTDNRALDRLYRLVKAVAERSSGQQINPRGILATHT